ncbi:sulfotransferase [Microbulbifer sp. ALW1]|uniref:sulfotransferase family protein n=1 Tax=Microbulbifer sp. (strain ALW1) TaxID=1516059 RepID=UPI0013594EEB|nr:sulfotransferase [Microbulbifer sp. ALW1]
MNPVFIVGVPRSGTTLLRELLSQNQEISMPRDEFQLIPKFCHKYPADRPLNIKEVSEIVKTVNKSAFYYHFAGRVEPLRESVVYRELAEDPTLYNVIKYILLYFSENKSGKYFGDKTPFNLFHLDDLSQVFPSAKIICVSRDPRDVCLSMRKAWGKSYLTAAEKWRDGIEAFFKFENQHPSDSLHIFYEELLSDTDLVMRRICDFLDIEYSSEMLTLKENREKMGAAKGAHGVVRDNHSKFLGKISAKNLSLIESICIDEMKICGYVPVQPTANVKYGTLYRFGCKFNDFMSGFRRHIKEKGIVLGVGYRLKQVIDSVLFKVF